MAKTYIEVVRNLNINEENTDQVYKGYQKIRLKIKYLFLTSSDISFENLMSYCKNFPQ